MKNILKVVSDFRLEEGISKFFSVPSRFFLLIFSILLINNLDRILDPPYWDAVMGVYTQGVWLSRNGFNYFDLFHQLGYGQGGPKTYFLYLMAPIYGALVLLLPLKAVFLILHLFTLSCAAGISTIFYKILREKMSFLQSLSWILTGNFAPVFNAQAASIYLELPMNLMLSLAIGFMWGGNLERAAVCVIGGYFMKPAAYLFSWSLMIFGILVLMFGRNRLAAGAQNKFYFVPFLFLFLLTQGVPVDQIEEPLSLSRFLNVTTFLKIWRYLLPDLLIFFVVMVLTFVVTTTKKRLSDDRERSLLYFLMLYVAAFWSTFVVLNNLMPRYAMMIVFPQLLILAILLKTHKGASYLTALSFLVFGILNQNGFLLASLPLHQSASGNVLERSREYLKDLDNNRDLCRFLEEKFPQSVIATSAPFTHILTVPEFGYVRKRLENVCSSSTPFSLSEVPRCDINELAKSKELLVVYSPSNLQGTDPYFKPKPQDEILFAPTWGGPIVFARRK